MRKVNYLVLTSIVISVILSGCKKPDDTTPLEQELITTVKLTLTKTGGSAVSITYKDPDGDGGIAPTISPASLTLDANSSYTAKLELLNETKTPVDDITTEIKEESEAHQFYYTVSGVNVSVSNLDTDTKGLPLGLTSTFTTTAVSNGSLKITLKHKPGQKAAGDLITKGETDVEVTFPVSIQ
jgi:hypothetical protein